MFRQLYMKQIITFALLMLFIAQPVSAFCAWGFPPQGKEYQPQNATEAFLAYEDSRYLRTARVQLTSRQFGEVYHAVGVQRDLRNALLANTRPEALYDTLGWVFGPAGADCLATSAVVG